MILLAVAAVIGPGLVLVAFGCWVASMFDRASELRAEELDRILRTRRDVEEL